MSIKTAPQKFEGFHVKGPAVTRLGSLWDDLQNPDMPWVRLILRSDGSYSMEGFGNVRTGNIRDMDGEK